MPYDPAGPVGPFAPGGYDVVTLDPTAPVAPVEYATAREGQY